MKLVQFLKNSKVALGIETENGIIDAAVDGARRGLRVPQTMIQAIRHGNMALEVLGVFAGTGLVVGVGGSMVAIRKFLQV